MSDTEKAQVNEEQIKQFVLHNVKRIVTNLFKGQLETCADLHQLYLSKLIKNKSKISPEIYADLSWWDVGAMGGLRKKTLDKGNDSLREIEGLFDKIDITFTLEK